MASAASTRCSRAAFSEQTIEQGFETLRQSIDLQDAQSRTTLVNALDVLDNQKANLDLAADVARVTRIKFNAGVGSNLEVITAETDLRTAQTNYYGAHLRRAGGQSRPRQSHRRAVQPGQKIKMSS
ncbi:MAG: TolC family protein [Hymenobacter sp.]